MLETCFLAAAVWAQPGIELIQSAYAARATMSSGRVECIQTLSTADASSERTLTLLFDSGKVRLEEKHLSDAGALFTEFGGCPDPSGIEIWTGAEFIGQKADLPNQGRAMNNFFRRAQIVNFFVNPVGAGLPYAAFGAHAVASPFSNVELLSDTQVGEARTVSIRADVTRPNGGVASGVEGTLTFDTARGSSLVAYELTTRSAAGNEFRLTGESQVDRFGDVWYPVSTVCEQHRNGAIEWRQELAVSSPSSTPRWTRRCSPGAVSTPGSMPSCTT